MSIEQPEVIAMLNVRKIEPGQYMYAVAHAGEVLYEDAGFTSIEEAISAANDQQGPIRGFEVAYGGIVVGTYHCNELKSAAAAVAEKAVERYAVFFEG